MNVSPKYDIGSPVLKNLWVDPVSGRDDADGSSRTQALRTLLAAWNRIPQRLDGHGWQILLCPGKYEPQPHGHIWLDDRKGTRECPIVIRPADAPQSSVLPGVFFRRSSFVYLLDVRLEAPGNMQVIPSDNIVLHYADCEDLLVRGVTAVGLEGPNGLPFLTLKANQCLRIYIEDGDYSGASGNALDYVAVHYGHIVRNRFHKTKAECMYVKGGSAYHLIAGNEMFDGKNHGVLAGQATGFQYMVPPWLHYEAYDIKIVNNVIHDAGSGLATFGGYNILMAWNTCYRVGSNRDAIVLGTGGRGWFGDRPSNVDEYLRLGGWSQPQGSEGYNIPCKNVLVCNNVIYNPDGYESRCATFGISGPVPTPEGSNLPNPSRTDDGLVIRGNVIWNGPATKPLLDDVEKEYHLAAKPTFDPAELLRNNAINNLRPELIDPDRGDFRPVPNGNLYSQPLAVTPDFTWTDAPTSPLVPQGNLDNTVPTDRAGAPRRPRNCIGAYV